MVENEKKYSMEEIHKMRDKLAVLLSPYDKEDFLLLFLGLLKFLADRLVTHSKAKKYVENGEPISKEHMADDLLRGAGLIGKTFTAYVAESFKQVTSSAIN